MRGLLVLLVLLVLIGAITWIAFGESVVVAIPNPNLRDDVVPEASHLEVPVEAVREVDVGVVPTEPSRRVRVSGTVVLLDSDEQRHENESGSLLVTHTDEAYGELEVEVVGGRFSFETDLRAALKVGSVKLRGVRCSLDRPFREVRPYEGMELVLEVHEVLPATLIVRDRVTREDLVGLTVWNTDGWGTAGLPPASARPVLSHQSSPIQLPTRGGKQTWWVSAEGYLCEQVSFDHRYGGELLVFLERASSMVVRLEGEGQRRVESVTVERVSVPRRLKVQGATVVLLRFEDLQPGKYKVRALGHGQVDNEVALAFAEVELRAGETSVLSLQVPALIERDPITISGVLEFPCEVHGMFESLLWRRTDPVGEPESVRVSWPFKSLRSDGTLLKWETQELSPGTWEVEVQPFGYRESVVIGDSDYYGVTLLVPTLAEVLVEVRSIETGGVLEDARVRWTLRGGPPGSGRGTAERTEEPGVFRFFTIPGVVWLSVDSRARSSRSHARATRVVGIDVGTQRFVFELHASRQISFLLRDGATIVKPHFGWSSDCKVERLDGVGEVSSRWSSHETAWEGFVLSAPGRYRFTFARIDGYLPIESLELPVEEPRMRVEIQLIRE